MTASRLSFVVAIMVIACSTAACKRDQNKFESPGHGPTVTSPTPGPSTPSSGNSTPQISGAPATEVLETGSYSFTPSVAGANPKKRLTFKIAGKPPWASFNSSTGQLSGSPGKGPAGRYENIRITVSNGKGNTALPAFSITVQQIGTGTATLSWQPPTMRTDGSQLKNLAGYRIHYGNAVGDYTTRITIDNPGISTYVVENLVAGTWYFVTTAFDKTGAESDYSNVASKRIG